MSQYNRNYVCKLLRKQACFVLKWSKYHKAVMRGNNFHMRYGEILNNIARSTRLPFLVPEPLYHYFTYWPYISKDVCIIYHSLYNDCKIFAAFGLCCDSATYVS